MSTTVGCLRWTGNSQWLAFANLGPERDWRLSLRSRGGNDTLPCCKCCVTHGQSIVTSGMLVVHTTWRLWCWTMEAMPRLASLRLRYRMLKRALWSLHVEGSTGCCLAVCQILMPLHPRDKDSCDRLCLATSFAIFAIDCSEEVPSWSIPHTSLCRVWGLPTRNVPWRQSSGLPDGVNGKRPLWSQWFPDQQTASDLQSSFVPSTRYVYFYNLLYYWFITVYSKYILLLRYGNTAGMSQCDLCPFGADCPGNSEFAPQTSRHCRCLCASSVASFGPTVSHCPTEAVCQTRCLA